MQNRLRLELAKCYIFIDHSVYRNNYVAIRSALPEMILTLSLIR